MITEKQRDTILWYSDYIDEEILNMIMDNMTKQQAIPIIGKILEKVADFDDLDYYEAMSEIDACGDR